MSTLPELLLALAFSTGATPTPSDEELANAPLLRRWSLARVQGDVGLALVGAVQGHPRLGDRPAVVTSELVAFCPDDGWAVTRSRVYRLAARDGGGDGHP